MSETEQNYTLVTDNISFLTPTGPTLGFLVILVRRYHEHQTGRPCSTDVLHAEGDPAIPAAPRARPPPQPCSQT